jgi:hypothetical protein
VAPLKLPLCGLSEPTFSFSFGRIETWVVVQLMALILKLCGRSALRLQSVPIPLVHDEAVQEIGGRHGSISLPLGLAEFRTRLICVELATREAAQSTFNSICQASSLPYGGAERLNLMIELRTILG